MNKLNIFSSITKILTWITIISTIIGTYIVIDNKYAKAADIKKLDDKFTKSILELRIMDLEDKIFKLELKQSLEGLSPMEEALLKRYNRQLNLLKEKNDKPKTRSIFNKD